MKINCKYLTTITGILFLGLPIITSAQSIKHLELPAVIQADIDNYYEFKTSVKNPVTTLLLTGIQKSTGQNPESEESKKMMNLTQKILNNNTLSFAMKMDGVEPTQENDYQWESPTVYTAFNLSPEDFQTFRTTSNPGAKEKTYNGITYYSEGDYSFLVYLDDLAIVTSKETALKKAIDNYKTPGSSTLANNPNYQETLKHKLTDGFLNFYVTPTSNQDNSSSIDFLFGENPLAALNKEINPSIQSAIKAESFSINQNNEGFNMSFFVLGDQIKLNQLDLAFNKYNFVPQLYNQISGKDLIFYQEGYNTKERLNDTMKVIMPDGTIQTMINNWKTELKKDSGLDFDVDLMSLLTKRNLVTLHNTNQILPGLTLMFEANNPARAKDVVSTFSTYIYKTLQKLQDKSGKQIFDYNNTYSAGGMKFDTYAIDLIALDNGDLTVPADWAKIYLRIGVNNDGLIVISTVKNLGAVLKNGSLNDDSGFASAFTNPGEEVEGIGYLNFGNTQKYIDNLSDNLPPGFISKDQIDQLFAPWQNLFLKSYADSKSAWGTGTLKVDVNKFGPYYDLFKQWFMPVYDYQTPPSMPNPIIEETLNKKFCDVNANDWYATYVEDLNNAGVINGYSDDCFRPNNPVTRAEFIKMLVLAGTSDTNNFKNNYAEYDKNPEKVYFNDIPGKASATWYSQFVNMAASEGYIKGYQDGGFHPNGIITRAEAIQIINNAGIQYKSGWSTSPQFKDVNYSDWFYSALTYAIGNGLVNNNSGTFRPNATLTRAEAAKFIKIFSDIEYSNMLIPMDMPMMEHGQ